MHPMHISRGKKTFFPYLWVKCLFMAAPAGNMATNATHISTILNKNILMHESPDMLAWLVLGGEEFMAVRPASVIDYYTAGAKGIPKLSVTNLATVLAVPMKDMALLLNLSYKTLGRKKESDIMDSISSSLSIEIAYTIAKGLSVFEDAEKLNRWLHKENRALMGRQPFNLLHTPTGIKLVNQVLGRIEDGVYT